MNLRKYRLAKHLTQEDLARKADLTSSYVARLEQGRHDPSLTIAQRLATALDVTLDKLLV
jgi:transcriptional regulator with XRE-family HTH domain